jgi:hypothetical protein
VARVLLLEGDADVTFYLAFCREVGIKDIRAVPPRSYGAGVDSKTNAIHILPILLQQLNDGAIANRGILVDADYSSEHGLGCSGTLAKIREQLVAHGFASESPLAGGGFLFKHANGLAPVGAWIMPDNKSDGMLEDFIQNAIAREHQPLHAHAHKIVGELRAPLFKPIHRAKAQVATWLAWQRIPGKGLESTVGDRLINLASPNCRALALWFHAVFP